MKDCKDKENRYKLENDKLRYQNNNFQNDFKKIESKFEEEKIEY